MISSKIEEIEKNLIKIKNRKLNLEEMIRELDDYQNTDFIFILQNFNKKILNGKFSM